MPVLGHMIPFAFCGVAVHASSSEYCSGNSCAFTDGAEETVENTSLLQSFAVSDLSHRRIAKHEAFKVVNDCRTPPANEAKASMQCGKAPDPWDGPTSCCCIDEECKGGDHYQGCQKKNPAPLQGKVMTHYWDCCRPSCAVSGEIKACDATGKTPVSFEVAQTSVCDSGKATTGASTCKSNIPQIIDGVLYGYGAMTGSTSADVPCGKCFEVKFADARGIDKAIVKVSNAGDSDPGNIDLLVPGGGFGQFNGCQAAAGWKVYTSDGGPCTPGGDNIVDGEKQCAQYGGFGYQKYCNSSFPGDAAAAKACNDILWGVFPQVGCNNDAGYPPNLHIVSSTQLDSCPSFFD